MNPPLPESLATPLRARILGAVLLAGLLVAAWVGGESYSGLAGIALAAAAATGLWWQAERSSRLALEEHRRLTELNRSLDEQVQARTLRLMQTIEDLESFNRMVTHDLRSPLTSLMLGLDLLAMKVEKIPEEGLKERVENITESASRMQEIVQDLRQLALISGRTPVVQELDLSMQASMVLRQLKQKDPQRRVIWNVEPGLAVFGDQSLMHIALENLLGNAWKYTLDRDPAEITVRRGEGDGVVLEIQDNGTGFDMAKADRLFLPFQRFHDDPRFPGHGIGLSIVKRVMLRHNGEISVSSAPGQGTTFRLHFSSSPVGEEVCD